MKFWELEPTEAAYAQGGPHNIYDCVSSMIVRASSEKQARKLAAGRAQDEGAECWLNPQWSTCEVYKFPTLKGKAEVIYLWDHPG